MSISPPPRQTLFRYLTANAAVATLAHMTTRWSSPLRFNDPFDTHFCLEFGFPLRDLQPILGDRMRELIESDIPLPEGMLPNIKTIVEGRRHGRRRGITFAKSPHEAAQAGIANAEFI